jgi:hypothetical protein
MKKAFPAVFRAAVIVTITVIALSTASCASSPSGEEVSIEPADLNGTWAASDGSTITFKNGDFDIAINKMPAVRGTYTTGAGNFKISVLQVNMAHPDLADQKFEKRWYTRGDFQARGASIEQLNRLYTTKTTKYSGGNTFKISIFGATDTFTRI